MAYVIEKALARARNSRGLKTQDELSAILYCGEAAIKYGALVVISALNDFNPQKGKLILRDTLNRGNGLGTWITLKENSLLALNRRTERSYRDIAKFYSEKNKALEYIDFKSQAIAELIEDISHDHQEFGKKRLDVERFVVFLRNKIAHGAKGDSFYAAHNSIIYDSITKYAISVSEFLDSICHFIDIRQRGNIQRKIVLSGLDLIEINSDELEREGISLNFLTEDIYVKVAPIYHWDRTNNSFYLPNSELDKKGSLEVIDYYTGNTRRIIIPSDSIANRATEKSHTAGGSALIVGDNSFHNLPDLQSGYISRPKLEFSLNKVLKDRKRRIITLQGRGGAGKTTLALRVAQQIASDENISADGRFDILIWLSSRNIDLLSEGPIEVVRDVGNLDTIAKYISSLGYFTSDNSDNSLKYIEDILGNPSSKVLLILDNFETMDNPGQVFNFIEEITEFPNKVLITSRIKQFEKDYSITVAGMEPDEAIELIQQEAGRENCSDKLTDKIINSILNSSGAIPYLMKLMVNALANNNPQALISEKVLSDDQIRERLFRPSFDRLSPSSQNIFQMASDFKIRLSINVLSGFSFTINDDNDLTEDIYKYIQEIVSNGLAGIEESNDLSFISIPPDAKRFGQIEFNNSSDRDVLIQAKAGVTENLHNILHCNDTASIRHLVSLKYAEIREKRLIKWADRFFLGMALIDPYLLISILNGRISRSDAFSHDDVKNLIRLCSDMAVEDSQSKFNIAKYYWSQKHYRIAMSYFIEATDLDQSNEHYLAEAARYFNEYLKTAAITNDDKSIYQSMILRRMEIHLEKIGFLNPESYSQLYWLYLRQGQTKLAKEITERGLMRHPHSNILQQLAEREIKS